MTKYATRIYDLINSEETLQIALSCFLFTWVLFVATPFDVIASNPDEFTFTPGSRILSMGTFYATLVFVFLMISYATLSLLMNRTLRKRIICIVFAVSISVWLNSTFLTGNYGVFDGRGNIHIDPYGLLSWIQISAFFVVFLSAVYFKDRPQIITHTLASICFISFSTSLVNITSKHYQKTITQGETKPFLAYSKNNPNLLIILLDEFQSDFFGHILDEKMKEDLRGFIWFQDAAANFPTTIGAIPSIFSGEVYDNNIDIKSFYHKVSDKSFAKRLSDKGFSVSSTIPMPPMEEIMFPDKSAVSFGDLGTEKVSSYINLMNYSIFRAVPDVIKLIIYNNGNWLFHSKNEDPYDAVPTGPAFKQLKYLANSQPNVTEGPSSFNFHHSVSTHSPTILDSNCAVVRDLEKKYDSHQIVKKVDSKAIRENQNRRRRLLSKGAEGKCVMSKVVQIIDNLKNKGVFDNTMIIITADHGSSYQPDSFKRTNAPTYPYSAAAPTLIIKPLKNNRSFQISQAPAQLSDIPKTVATALNMTNISYTGIDLLSDDFPKYRSRIFNHYSWTREYHNWSKSRVPPITKYEITGPLNDPNSWEKIVTFNHDYQVKGLSGKESWGQWSDGPKVEIMFRTEPNSKNRSIQFNLTAFITPKNPKQTASVFINDKSVGNIQISSGESLPKQFTFALPDTQDHQYTIRFEIDKPTTPKSVGFNADCRELGFGFIDIKLLP